MITPVDRLREYAEEYECRSLCERVLTDWRFPLWSASSKSTTHHYGMGGLAKHTLEVVELCFNANDYFNVDDKGVDDMQIFLTAFFHDVGKMWDYKATNPEMTEWEGTKHKETIHHISRSVMVWVEEVERAKLDAAYISDEFKDEVSHAILAHHGLREWGSPVSPKTKLAWILHTCDMLSARMDECQ